MNDKIKELANRSGLRTTKLCSNPMVTIVDGKETELAKFAELIIKECIGVFEEKIKIRYAGDQKSVDVGYGMELVIDSIKQKFGVL